jgi:DNA-binding phage protein
MNPHDAIKKLLRSDWTMAQIAEAIGMNRTNLYKVHAGAMPRYDYAVALIETAKRGKKPPREKTA